MTGPFTCYEIDREVRTQICLNGNVLAIIRDHPGSTYAELFAVASDTERAELRETVAVARRLPDLERAGMVRRGDARVCRVKGTRMQAWSAT